MKQPNCCTKGNTPISVTHETLRHCRQSQCPYLNEAETTGTMAFVTPSTYPDCEYCLDSILEMEISHLDSSREM